jgi:pre-rRNA-processing protein TSR1
LKKVVLTGFPVKVHKKKAVVRWMFHAPEDVRYFRPVDLWTKHGRQGRIKVKLIAPHPSVPGSCHCFSSLVNSMTYALLDTPALCGSLVTVVF